MSDISTVVTDYLLAGLSALFGFLLLRDSGASLPRKLWGWALLASALAALAGGTWHGFQHVLPERALFWIWKAVIYLIGAFGLLAVGGTLMSAASGWRRAALLAPMIAVTAVYAAYMTTHDEFIYVIYFNAMAMVFVLLTHLYTRYRWSDPASPWMIAGVLVSGLAAAVQASGVSVHEHFNHNDLFHVIQMIGVYLLYRGASRLGPPRSAAA